MAKYEVFLYDDIGNEHERKNLYLKELAQLQKDYAETKDEGLKSKISSLKSEKSNHAYILKLKEFKATEQEFKKSMATEISRYAASSPKELSRRMLRLKKEEKSSQLKVEFYKKYQDLSYDTYYEYEKALIEVRQYPGIIGHLEENEKGLKEARKASRTIDPDVQEEAKNKYLSKKSAIKLQEEEEINGLKKKKEQGLISKKALKDQAKEIKLKHKDEIHVEAYEVPVRSNREQRAYHGFEINKTSKRKVNVLKANVADLRRKTPTEYERLIPINGLIGLLIPGLGQLLNKQYIKALLFFLGTLFVYGIAIPYALGYGNYRGEGVAGLISLAEGGKKIDRSLIFMIEGIIAIFLLVFAFFIYILNFKDAYQVEKDKIKGIRPKNWFESWVSISEEGFPYMVSLPALIVTVFIVIVPITTAILLSFTNMDPKHQNKFQWVGLANYKLIALGEGIAGQAFWLILGWTLVWTLVATSLAIFIGFSLALLVNQDRVKFKSVFRGVYLLPWAVPAFITIMFFSIMLSPDGALTGILNNIAGTRVEVKNSANLTRIALIAMQGWLGSSYVFLLSTGVLQAIPGDLYEAAQIDGATTWQKLRKITLPIVLFQTAPLLVGQYTFNFNNFSIIYLFNQGGPFNPSQYGNLAGTSDLLISYIYKLTMDNQYQAIGAAITIVISLGLMLFAFIGFKNSKAFKEEKL